MWFLVFVNRDFIFKEQQTIQQAEGNLYKISGMYYVVFAFDNKL
jgi:hypothetical protein